MMLRSAPYWSPPRRPPRGRLPLGAWAFAVGELASEDFAASRTTLLTLAERVASSRASVFSAEVENELLNVGTRGEDVVVGGLVAQRVAESWSRQR